MTLSCNPLTPRYQKSRGKWWPIRVFSALKGAIELRGPIREFERDLVRDRVIAEIPVRRRRGGTLDVPVGIRST